jgi:hypothetical protein
LLARSQRQAPASFGGAEEQPRPLGSPKSAVERRRERQRGRAQFVPAPIRGRSPTTSGAALSSRYFRCRSRCSAAARSRSRCSAAAPGDLRLGDQLDQFLIAILNAVERSDAECARTIRTSSIQLRSCLGL